MKWRSPSQKTQNWIIGPIAIPLAVVAGVLLSPVIALAWLEGRWAAHQRAKGRHSWFAWHPVHFDAFWYDDVPSCWLWLERIERRRTYNGWQYWPLGFIDPFDKVDA